MGGIRKARYDYVGYKYNGMEVIERTTKRTKGGVSIWKVRCSCGEIHELTSTKLKRKSIPRECKNFKPWNKKYNSVNDGRLYRCYGITQKDYNKMFKDQKGCCAVCGKHQSELSKPLCVDHNHKSGQVRNLLCNMCNTFLGIYNEDTKLFENFISYIGKWSNAS